MRRRRKIFKAKNIYFISAQVTGSQAEKLRNRQRRPRGEDVSGREGEQGEAEARGANAGGPDIWARFFVAPQAPLEEREPLVPLSTTASRPRKGRRLEVLVNL